MRKRIRAPTRYYTRHNEMPDHYKKYGGTDSGR